ncbi:DNA helicase [Tanacetum coccineum]
MAKEKEEKVTMNAYYKYQLHPQRKEFGLILKGGRLFQQYVVTVFCAIEQSRLDFIRRNQNDLRSDFLSGLYDAVSRGDHEGIAAGSKIMLPNTFTGGPRYMYSHYLDALAICRSLGNPQFFITFTCNVKWPEIKRYMAQFSELTPTDKADIVCRVFEQKVKDFLRFLKEVKTFGYVSAVLYTIEFPKRGLPHCHTLLWIESRNTLKDTTQIDEYISAEIPDPVQDPRGYKLVTKLMMHGLCLKFGKITTFEVLTCKESEFPEHHFEFIAYNQLASRVPYQDENSKTIYLILTRCICSIGDVTPFGDANTGQKYLRKVEIENLDGNILEFTIWDEVAKQFNKQEIQKLTPPIIIAVSSCRVTKYRDVQLTATPATYYYINPRTPEAEYAYTVFKEKYRLTPPLQTSKYRYEDPEQEKMRNIQTLQKLLQQNPTSYKGVRFTCEAMITSVRENRDWKYASCSQCSKGSTQLNGIYTCEDHGKQDPVTYRYNFKATATDGTSTAQFTFFTNAGQKITGHPCSQLAQKYKETGDRQFPIEIVNIIGKKHIFQIRFAPSTKKGAGEFVAEDILDIETAVETHTTGTGTILATGSATSSKESTSIDKGTSGTILATHPTEGTNEPINEETQTPGTHCYFNNKASTFITSNIIHTTDIDAQKTIRQ